MSSHSKTISHYSEKTQFLLADMPDYVTDFINDIHAVTSNRTQYEYTLDIRHLLEYIAIRKPISKITEQDLEKLTKQDFESYLDRMTHYSENGKDIYNGYASLKRKLIALRNFFDYMYQEGKIQTTNIRNVPVPKAHEKDKTILNQKETDELLSLIKTEKGLTKKQRDYNKIQSTRDLAVISLIISTGIRVSECTEIDISDVDMSKKCVQIIKRNNEKQTISFSDETAACLADYMSYRKNIAGLEKEPALFISSQKRRICTRAIENLVKKYGLRLTAADNITPHKLRTARS